MNGQPRPKPLAEAIIDRVLAEGGLFVHGDGVTHIRPARAGAGFSAELVALLRANRPAISAALAERRQAFEKRAAYNAANSPFQRNRPKSADRAAATPSAPTGSDNLTAEPPDASGGV